MDFIRGIDFINMFGIPLHNAFVAGITAVEFHKATDKSSESLAHEMKYGQNVSERRS